MKMSELQRKDIVDINDGKIIGRVIDAEIDKDSAVLINLVIEKNRYLRSMFSNDNDLNIRFNQIKKIGTDVILVDLT